MPSKKKKYNARFPAVSVFAGRGQSRSGIGGARRSVCIVDLVGICDLGIVRGCEKCLFMCAKEEGFLFCVLLCVSFQNLILLIHFAGQNQEDHADRRGGRQGGPGRTRYNLYPLQKL